METNSEIKIIVEKTISSVDHMNEVGVSPFFKEKVMHRIRNASEEEDVTISSWFTPKLQLATLVAVIILNVIAFSNLEANNYDENVNEFAESYGLSTSTNSETLILSEL